MGRSASFITVSSGRRKERETGTKMLRGIFQRLKIAASYLTLNPTGTKGHLSHENDRWEHKEVLYTLGKIVLLGMLVIHSKPRNGEFRFPITYCSYCS